MSDVYSQILTTIETSKYYSPVNELIGKYYPGATKDVKCGLYVNSFDRFMMVDSTDLWVMFDAAKILSSKFQCSVYVLHDPLDINNNNCLLYSIKSKQAHLATELLPSVVVDDTEIFKVGPPKDYTDYQAFSRLVQQQEFCLFVLRCCYAIKCMDSKYNLKDMKQYGNYFPDRDVRWEFDHMHESDIKFEDNYLLPSIEQILYKERNISDSLESITTVFNYARDTDVDAQKEHLKRTLTIPLRDYKLKFFELVGHKMVAV